MEYQPHEYQKRAIRFLLEHGAAGLFLDPGLGKTSITLAAISILKGRGIVQRTLVIAPLRVCHSVWPAEIKKWADFNHLKCVVLHGHKKDEALQQDADIYLVNPEGLQWLCSEDRMRKLSVDMLVVDESSKFRHTNTQRFKLLKPHLKSFRRRYALTGTPSPNGLLDLFGQVYLLDLGNALGPYITKYRMQYFNPMGFGGYTWVIKPGAEEQIHEKLRPLTLRMAAEDYLELPELVENTIRVELPPKVRKIYDEMEAALFSVLDNGEGLSALSAGAAANKCRQIANGGAYRTASVEVAVDSDRWTDLHTAKTDAVVDLVEELGGKPVLVAYDFAHDLARLRAAFGKDCPYLGGGVSPKRTEEVVTAWNRGEIPVLLGHPAAMGHGLNLQGCGQHIIWHSLTWDLELYEQFVRRVFRQGNKHTHVFVHHIVATKTIDEAILKALHSKAKTQKALLDALKDYKKEKE